jgi:hypothetical protein
MERDYDPRGWLGLILGAKLFFEFSGKYPFDQKAQELLKEINGHLQNIPEMTPHENVPPIKTPRTGNDWYDIVLMIQVMIGMISC